MKRKFLIVILAIVAALCLTFGVTACGDNTNGGQADNGKNTEQNGNTPDDGNTPEEGNISDDGNSERETVVGTEGLEYTLLPDGESYALTGLGTAQGPEITIASHVDGKPVTQIGQYVFTEYEDMPEKFKQMPEAEILNECGIFAGESYKSNVDDSFEPSTVVKKVNIPDTVTAIGYFAFVFCDLEGIEIPDSVTTISAYAFWCCWELANVTIPDSVSSIGVCAFSECYALESVTIGNGTIGRQAFAGGSFASVKIGSGVTSIGEIAFADCLALTDIYFDGTKTQWNAIEKDLTWNKGTRDYTIHCTDGDIEWGL